MKRYYRLAILLGLMPFLVIGCARYKLTTTSPTSGAVTELNIISWRKFPEGLSTQYGDFKFEAGAVDNPSPPSIQELMSLWMLQQPPAQPDGE